MGSGGVTRKWGRLAFWAGRLRELKKSKQQIARRLGMKAAKVKREAAKAVWRRPPKDAIINSMESPRDTKQTPKSGHPWLRYGAKITDLGIVLMLLYLIPGVHVNILGNTGLVLATVLLVPLEVLAYKYFGKTPGKALYNLDIWQNNKKVSDTVMWQRSSLAMVTGLGLGLWFVQLVAMPYQYWKLKTQGGTQYDRWLDLTVEHRPLSWTQKGVIALTHIGSFWILWNLLMAEMTKAMTVFGQ